MLAINLRVTFGDGAEREVTARTSDFVAFESHFDKSFQVIQAEQRLTYLLFLAWHADKRAGDTELEFEPWADTVQMVTADPKASPDSAPVNTGK